MPGRRREVEVISREQAAIVGANIRALRVSKGWTQAQVGDLMGWTSNSTVCAAEGRGGGRQRRFTLDEVERLAGFFGIKAWQLTTRCVNCGGQPPTGFACLTCGAKANGAAKNSPWTAMTLRPWPQTGDTKRGQDHAHPASAKPSEQRS